MFAGTDDPVVSLNRLFPRVCGEIREISAVGRSRTWWPGLVALMGGVYRGDDAPEFPKNGVPWSLIQCPFSLRWGRNTPTRIQGVRIITIQAVVALSDASARVRRGENAHAPQIIREAVWMG